MGSPGFAPHPNSVALAPRVLRVVIDLDNLVIFVRWCRDCKLPFNIGPRLFKAATFASSGTLTSCLAFSYNDAFSDLLVLRAVWSACCADTFSQRPRVTAFSAIPSLCRLGGAFALPPTSLSDSSVGTSETRRISGASFWHNSVILRFVPTFGLGFAAPSFNCGRHR